MNLYRSTILKPLFEAAVVEFSQPLIKAQLAHLIMLRECELLTEAEYRALGTGTLKVANELKTSTPEYDDAYEDLYFWFESRLGELIGAELAGRAHLARSRNDLDHTLFRMVLRDKLHQLRSELLSLVDTLLLRAEKESKRVIVAYTHGQPAQPSTFGHYLHALVEVLLRRCDGLMQASITVDQCPLGAAAITTTGFPINRQRVADLLGFAKVSRNSYAAIAGADYLTQTYTTLKLLAVDLGRFVNDLTFQTSFEVATLKFDAEFVQISSIMPQKRNPVVVEHLRHLMSATCGLCDMVVDTLRNTPFADINDSEGESQMRGYAAFDHLEKVMMLLQKIVSTLEIDDLRVAEILRMSCCTSTELADTLVRSEGVSFRDAHHVASKVSDFLFKEGLSTDELSSDSVAEIFESVVGRKCKMEPATLKECLSPEYFVKVRDRLGGPSTEAFRESEAHYRTELNSSIEGLKAEVTRVNEALLGLDKNFA